MKHIDDDELVELSVRVIEKLSCMSDEEFSGIDIEFVELYNGYVQSMLVVQTHFLKNRLLLI